MNQTIEPDELTLADVLRPFFRYWWVVALMVIVSTGAVALWVYTKPQVYRSEALISVNNSLVHPKVVEQLLDLSGLRKEIEATSLASGVIQVKATGRTAQASYQSLTRALEQTSAIVEAMLPDYEAFSKASLGQYRELAAGAEDTTALGALVNRASEYQVKDLMRNSAIEVFAQPYKPTIPEPRNAIQLIALTSVLALLLGYTMAWVLDNRRALFGAQALHELPNGRDGHRHPEIIVERG